jgi:hypothetical protein
MHQTGLNYHDLLVAALGQGGNFQAFIDGYFANKYNTQMWDDFDFDVVPMMNYTYQDFQKELKMTCMATIVNPDSKAKESSTEGFTVLSGVIPTLSKVLTRDAKEVRDLMQIQAMQSNSTAAVAIAQLHEKVDAMLEAHTNSISYFRNQMMSLGSLTTTAANNPGGLQDLTLSAQIPVTNTTTKLSTAAWWTSAAHTTEGSTSDPIKDMKAKVKQLKDVGISDVTLEVDSLTLDDILLHSKVITAVGYSVSVTVQTDANALAVGTNMDDDARLLALGKIIKAKIKPVDHIATVETYNKTTKTPVKTQIRSFAADRLIFRPTGNAGTIKHVMPVIPFGGTTATYFNGSMLMRVYNDINTNVQYYNTEQAVLPVINKPKYIYTLVVV